MPILPSLRSRLLLLLATAFLLLFGGAVHHFAGERTENLAHARQDLLRSARLMTVEEALRVARAHALLHSLAPLIAQASDKCQHEFALALATNPAVNNIVLARANGQVICAAKPSGQALDLVGQRYFKAALNATDRVVGGPVPSASRDGVVIPVAEPVVDQAGHSQKVLVVFVRLSWPQAMRVRDELPTDVRLVVRDGLGRAVLRYPERGAQAEKHAPEAHLAKLALLKHEGFADISDSDGVQRVYAFVPFLQTVSGPLTLWVGESRDAITAPVVSTFRWGIGIALGVVVLTLGLIWIGSDKLFLRRLSELSRAAKQMANGNLSARTQPQSPADEIGALSRTFNEMAEGLQQKDDQLRAANKNLERINRTLRVLSGANRALLQALEEKQLLDEVCRVLIDLGSYRMAWVGYTEDEKQKTVRPVAYHGIESQDLNKIVIADGDVERGQGPSSTAIRTAAPVVIRRILTEPGFEAWRAEALQHGYSSTIALPLSMEGKVQGVLRVYAVEADAFGADELAILTEAANDVSLGIGSVRSRKRGTELEKTLHKSQQRVRAAALGSLDAFCILRTIYDDSGKPRDFEFVDVNSQAEKYLALSREQLLGGMFRELFPDYEELFKRYVPVATGGVPREERFLMRTPGGRNVWLRHQIVPLEDGVAVFWRDITEGMEASQKLKASEKKYRELLEGLQEGIWAVDPEGRTTFVNVRMAEMLGYSVEELLKKPVFDFLAERDAQAIKEHFAQRRQGIRNSYDMTWIRKDGGVLYTRNEGAPLYDETGAFIGSLAGVIDITERRRGEIALERANRALKTISAANEALVRANDEPHLLQAACRVIVEEGGYPKAWVGFAEHDIKRTITPKAWAGLGVEVLMTQRDMSWAADSPEGHGLVAQVIRTGRSGVSNDITSDPNVAFSRETALSTGTRSVLVLPLLAGKDRALGFLSIHGNQPGLFDDGHIALLRRLADDLSYGIESLRAKKERDRIAHENLHHAEILRKSLMDSIKAIGATVEVRDPYTAGHQERVAELAVAIARELGLSEEDVQGVYVAGIVHDLGKIGTPAEMLNKPGKLTDVEFALIKQHAEAGYAILKNVEFPWPIADIVRQHHERLNGSGYPLGLKDGDILPEARILAVADVVEAMASHRPYRPGRGIEQALEEIERGRGILYDTSAANACLRLFREGRFSLEKDQYAHSSAAAATG